MTEEQVTAGIFLRRLERLIRIRFHYREEFNYFGAQMISRAISATYGDCLDYGVDCEADAIMSKGRTT